ATEQRHATAPCGIMTPTSQARPRPEGSRMPRTPRASLLCTAALLLLAAPPLRAEDARGEKVALLAGVRAYDHSKLGDLRFPDRDVEEMAALLRQTGYTRVVVLSTALGERE